VKTQEIINNSKATTAILSVSPHAGDQDALARILRQDSQPSQKWKLAAASTLEAATAMLRINQFPIALCEHDLSPGTWKELFGRAMRMPHSPLVIVTSRLADERMWAEALNLGAWEVLAKPFDPAEVIRVVDSAWRHWQERHESAAAVYQWLRAAG